MKSYKTTRGYGRFARYALAATLISLFLWSFLRPQDYEDDFDSQDTCSSFRHINEDIFVVVKTGACEIDDKLPVHLKTSFECIPSYAVYSDHESSFQGLAIHDSFYGHVSQEVIHAKDEFQVYRKLQEVGSCGGLNATDLQSETIEDINGHTSNRSWVLDKWKFLPMVRKVYEQRPDAKWYFLVETDTHIVWQNLHHWLQRFDPTQPHYIGSQMLIGEQIFAQGGAGTLISNPAMKLVVEQFKKNQDSLEAFTGDHWAGDCVLGKAFEDAGVKMLWAWPHLLVDSVSDVIYTESKYNKRTWCSPVLSYHHMTPAQIRDFWPFQQEFFAKHSRRVLRHRDVFREYLMPKVQRPLDDWDNESEDAFAGFFTPRSFQQCHEACLRDMECLQFSFSGQECKTSKRVHIGHSTEGSANSTRSGWVVERLGKMARGMTSCTRNDEAWVVDFYGWV